MVLALRKWYDLRPEMEFRGFVQDNVLVGICQREVTGFYVTLLGREEEITDLIADFFFENLQEVFGGGNFSFDVYITTEGKVKLMDFNTWGGAQRSHSCSPGRSLKISTTKSQAETQRLLHPLNWTRNLSSEL